ncbi:MAG: Holliday junction resolvase RuvX [Bacteroidota bacterium]|jgi:putative Holliday junction resolvase|nr:Holliday junction resolvase RuvX [Bacteroidota bacterium]MCA4897585.1 Holliday junction resolvase RuvX [Cytophagales bacterium]MCE2955831.1 Holliday junction resolvase RuvX [Flammeovirgaceae bacterium]MCZ8069494.1 Holliday junction resolvase RuvX [Cytophagales bacterium]
MARILSIDYGIKRTGLAVTDPQQIIATALETVETARLIAYLKTYFEKEAVDEVVIGMPKQLNNQDSDTAPNVRQFIGTFKKNFPAKPITTIDERFTTSIAQQAMLMGGMKKKDRQIKGQSDKISAVLILQDYMQGKKR